MCVAKLVPKFYESAGTSLARTRTLATTLAPRTRRKRPLVPEREIIIQCMKVQPAPNRSKLIANQESSASVVAVLCAIAKLVPERKLLYNV